MKTFIIRLGNKTLDLVRASDEKEAVDNFKANAQRLSASKINADWWLKFYSRSYVVKPNTLIINER